MVDTAITTTSVSFALMVMDLLPCDVASLACTSTLVSASSWEHGATASREWPHFVADGIISPCHETMMVLVVSSSHILCARKLNSCVLLLSSRRKLLQFWGVFVVPVTLRLIPRPPSVLFLAQSVRIVTVTFAMYGACRCYSVKQELLAIRRQYRPQ